MTRMLILDEEVVKATAEDVAKARLKPTPWNPKNVYPEHGAETITLEERGEFKPVRETVCRELDMGFRCAFSFEEQPGGLFRHLSISVDVRGNLPNPTACVAICELYGFARDGKIKFWREEYQPGYFAVNFVQLAEEANADLSKSGNGKTEG